MICHICYIVVNLLTLYTYMYVSILIYFSLFYRLRQESELLSRQSHHWSENDLSSVCSNSVAPSPIPLLNRQCNSHGNGSSNSSQHHSPNSNNNNNNNNSSESTSSTETLKWLGSMSDISEASHVTGYSAIAESGECNR